jgi:hypothetical protein
LKSTKTDTVDMPARIIIPAFKPDAKRCHGFCGIDDILAFQQAGDDRFTRRHGTEHQGTMRD